MKFAWNVIATDVQPRNVLAFFFHARGQELQHNLEGMYRSLLHQLFSKRQDTQKAIDAMPEKLSSKPDERIEDLRTLFRDAFSHVGNEPLYCFVDALDECDDELAQEIVDLLGVQLKDIARDRKSVLRICLSSRHYPTVKARGGRSIILENYSGHREDMAQYIDSKLDLEDPTYRDQVRTKMLEKARGIFLWIVVVVQVINRDDEKGDLHSILKRIDDTPDDIKSLLDRIVPDVAPNESGEGDSFWLCMSWIAHARRPLSLDELYWAIVSSNPDNSWEHWSSDLVSRSIMERFVTTASRGLVEETENSPQIMEYIHETVREYFSNIDSPQGARIIANAAFMAITKGCSFYLLNAPVVTYLWKHPDASQSTPARQSHLVAERFPFLAYVVDHLFYHINLDPLSTLSNSLLDFPLLTWILPWLILSEGTMNKSRFLYGASLASVAAMQGAYSTFARALQHHTCSYFRRQRRMSLSLMAALDVGDLETVQEIIHKERGRPGQTDGQGMGRLALRAPNQTIPSAKSPIIPLTLRLQKVLFDRHVTDRNWTFEPRSQFLLGPGCIGFIHEAETRFARHLAKLEACAWSIYRIPRLSSTSILERSVRDMSFLMNVYVWVGRDMADVNCGGAQEVVEYLKAVPNFTPFNAATSNKWLTRRNRRVGAKRVFNWTISGA